MLLLSISSIDSTYRSLKSNFPELKFISGKRFTGNESEEEYREWIKYDLHMKVERYSLEENNDRDKKYIKD